MFEQPLDLLSIQYFLEQNLANLCRSTLINTQINGKQQQQNRQPIIYNSNSVKTVSEFQQLKPSSSENSRILVKNESENDGKLPIKAITG
jgi:hypothetical protein